MSKKKSASQASKASEEKQIPTFSIKQISIEDVSFEVPHRKKLLQKKWEPNVHVDLKTEHEPLEDSHYRVVLGIHTTVKLGDDIAFVVEVKQAGIFEVKHFDAGQMQPLLEAYCPNILFPYAREMMSSLVGHGGFPPLHLAPVNFDAIYEEKMQQQRKEAKIGK